MHLPDKTVEASRRSAWSARLRVSNHYRGTKDRQLDAGFVAVLQEVVFGGALGSLVLIREGSLFRVELGLDNARACATGISRGAMKQLWNTLDV